MALFSLEAKVFFGPEALRDFLKHMASLNIGSLSFIADKSLAREPAFLGLVRAFAGAGFKNYTIDELPCGREPTYDELDGFMLGFRKRKPGFILAAGGGSVLDIAKAAAVLLNNPGKAIDYRGMDKVKSPGVSIACFPSTAGTGSEITHTASFIDTVSRTKLGINGKNVCADFACLLPELTFSCPEKVTLSSGLDALVHAIEAVSARNANSVSIMLGKEAFGLIYKNFKKALEAPRDYSAREGMLLGSCLAGLAMMHAAGGLASGISYPLGVHYRLAHGLAGGVFLPHVISYNAAAGFTGYSCLYDVTQENQAVLSPGDKSAEFARAFREFYRSLNAPEKLNDFGLMPKDAAALTALTMEQRKANLELNPVACLEKDVSALIEGLIR